MIHHQYLAVSSVQVTADTLYVSVGWVSRSLKKIRGMYKRGGHVWGNRRAGHPRKLTSKYIYTVGLGVSTGVCSPMGILVYKVIIQNTSRPGPSVGSKPKTFTKMKLHAFPTKCVGLSPISQKSYLKLKTK